MQGSIRVAFAAVLWACALVPLSLVGLGKVAPEAAVGLANGLEWTLRWVLSAAVLTTAAGLMLYPPFLPQLRLRVHRIRTRMSTDQNPLREVQARLEHIETAADQLTCGRMLAQLGRIKPALEHLARAVELDPEHAPTRYQYGLALTDAKQVAAAADQLGKMFEIDPTHAFGAGMLEYGIALSQAGRNEQACEILDRHEREYGATRRSLLARARARHARGDTDGAREDLREAARPAGDDRRLTREDDLARAHARLALALGGRP